MASAVYPSALVALLQGDLTGGLDAYTVKATLIDTADYTYDAAHTNYAAITAAGRVGTATELASKTFGVSYTGAMDAADTTLTSVSGDQSEAVVIWADDGVAENTSYVLSYCELTAAVTPNGGNIVLQYHASGVFSI